MKIVIGKSALLKLVIIGVFAALLLTVGQLGINQNVLASAFGPTPSHTDAPGEGNCTACHVSFPLNSGDGNVQILGIPANYMAGQQIAISVVLSQEDATNYGFQLTAVDSLGQSVGAFSITGQNPPLMQIVDGIVESNIRKYVEHTSDGLFTEGVFGSNTWTFTWTAPSQPAGRVDFYVAANAANGDGGTGGDYIYTDSASSLSAAVPLVSVSGRVFTPNGLVLRNTKLVLTDPNNVQRSAFTSSFGVYSFADVQSGLTYTLNAQSKRYRFSAKVISINDNLTDINFTGLE